MVSDQSRSISENAGKSVKDARKWLQPPSGEMVGRPAVRPPGLVQGWGKAGDQLYFSNLDVGTNRCINSLSTWTER